MFPKNTKKPVMFGNEKQKNYDDKESDILRIIKYQDSKVFGKHLQDDLKTYYTRESLLQKSKNEIHSILTRIRLSLNNQHIDKMMDSMAVSLAVGLEKTVDPFYDCAGFSDNLLENQQFWSVFERYKIESGAKIPDIPPWLQMAYIVSSTLVLTHQLNKTPTTTIEPPNKNVNEILEDIETPKEQTKKEKSNLTLGGKI